MPAGEQGQATGKPDAQARGPRRLPRLWRWLPAILCAIVAAGLGGWVLKGGHVLVMRTPSMGTAAQAGSLVLTRPLGNAPLHRGMIVAFRVPNTGEIYTHRIAALFGNGRFRTRGDLNSADDGWELTRSAIVGVPVLVVPVLGWLVLGLPWALAVLAVGTMLGRLLPRSARPAVRSAIVGGMLALPLYVVRPFVRVTIAGAGPVTPAASHSARSAAVLARHIAASHTLHGATASATVARAGKLFAARLVDGGVLPLHVTLRSAHTVIQPGHAGVITARLASQASSTLEAHAVLPLWGWAVLAALVLAPLPVGVLGLRQRIAVTNATPEALVPNPELDSSAPGPGMRTEPTQVYAWTLNQ